MNTPTDDNRSPKKITVKIAKNRLSKSPLKEKRRRRSLLPFQSMESINNSSVSKIRKTESFTKNSNKGGIPNHKIFLKEIINTSIPEVSEKSSNNDKEEKKGKNNKKKDDKYIIHYIKNVYEKDSHFNKENIIKSAKKNIHDSFLKFLQNTKNNFRNSSRRRNSALNANFFKSNIHNINVILNKNHVNKKKSGSIIDRKKSEEKGNEFHKKNSGDKEKEIVTINLNKNKHKHNKQKEKENENGKVVVLEDKNSNKDKTIKSNDKTVKEILENEKKTETENNTENTKTKKKKKNKIKKFLCCLLNSNSDTSIENN